MKACKICRRRGESIWLQIQNYERYVPEAQVCYTCALQVANAFNMAHSGRWLTWENPPVQKRAKGFIPRRLQKAVFERDAYRCKHCSSHIDLCADHIHPESKGGETTLENLQTLCRSCNSKKGASLPEAVDA